MRQISQTGKMGFKTSKEEDPSSSMIQNQFCTNKPIHQSCRQFYNISNFDMIHTLSRHTMWEYLDITGHQLLVQCSGSLSTPSGKRTAVEQLKCKIIVGWWTGWTPSPSPGRGPWGDSRVRSTSSTSASSQASSRYSRRKSLSKLFSLKESQAVYR